MTKVVKKHSVKIRGRCTSFSLEDEFFKELSGIARELDYSGVEALIGYIDEKRRDRPEGAPMPNLSNAIRVFVLEDLKARTSRKEIAA